MNHPSFYRVSTGSLFGAALFVGSVMLVANGCGVDADGPSVSGASAGISCSSNSQCSPGTFCSQPLVSACGLAGDLAGTCEPRPNSCQPSFSPVCGCDDQTYDNECLANAAGVSIVRPGECPGVGDVCTATGVPCGLGLFCNFPISAGCGNDPGVCEPIPVACPSEFLPVCACDANTYDNECLASAAGVAVAAPGECGG
jgi:hypothetical protein